MARRKSVDLEKASRKSLPHNNEAEKNVLGSMIRSSNKLSEAFGALEVEDFYPENENHRAIFGAMYRLYSKGQPVDVTTLVNELTNSRELEVSGGVDYLLELSESVISFTNFNQYVRIVQEQALLRKYLVSMEEIIDEYYDNDIDDPSTFVGLSHKKLTTISDKRKTGDFQTAQQVSGDLAKEIGELKEATSDDTVTGIPTGYPRLNRYTHGFQKGEFIVLAARPGVGKTALALNLAYNAAMRNVPVAYFSLEMPAKMLFKRLAAAESNVQFNSLITGFGLNRNNARLRLIEACKRLATARFYVDDTSGINLLDLEAKIKTLYNKEPDLGLVVVDYMGLVTTNMKGKNDSRQLEMQMISQTLKKLALELHISIIGVAQLNRKVEDRPGGEPQLSDLRESGSLEQDADIVLLLHEPKISLEGENSNSKKSIFDKSADAVNKAQDQVAKKDGGPDTSIVNVIIAKNRSGNQGKVPLLFRKNYCKFDSPSTESENELASLESERITYFAHD